EIQRLNVRARGESLLKIVLAPVLEEPDRLRVHAVQVNIPRRRLEVMIRNAGIVFYYCAALGQNHAANRGEASLVHKVRRRLNQLYGLGQGGEVLYRARFFR